MIVYIRWLDPGVIRTALNDHYPTFCIITKCSVVKKHISIYRRNITKFDPSIYCNDINLNLIELSKKFTEITPQNINLIFEEFILTITNTMDSQTPLKALSRKQRKLKLKPWITKGILICIKNKQKLYKSHFLKGNDAHRAILQKVCK